MREITDVQEYRDIQLSIMDSIAEVCDRNGIKYTLACGTLIGALRHKGYIPWDDDIDIYMTREEYNRFCKIYNNDNKVQDSPYMFQTPECSPDYMYPYGKVVDTRTVLIEGRFADYKTSVFVDVFPLDYVPESLFIRKIQLKFAKILHKFWICKRCSCCCLATKVSYNGYRYFPIPMRLVEWLMKRFVYGCKKTSLLFDMNNANINPPTATLPVTAMQAFTMAEFEGRHYSIMTDYDSYLNRLYKIPYMSLPPEEQRVTRHDFVAYWKDE